jgi:hypothetical protein
VTNDVRQRSNGSSSSGSSPEEQNASTRTLTNQIRTDSDLADEKDHVPDATDAASATAEIETLVATNGTDVAPACDVRMTESGVVIATSDVIETIGVTATSDDAMSPSEEEEAALKIDPDDIITTLDVADGKRRGLC